MKSSKIILAGLFLLFCFYINPADATQLPEPIVDFIKKNYPDVAIRFDGLVEFPDNTRYLPVLPLEYKKTENPSAIVQTIPKDTEFSQKPNMVLFANDLALLKIVEKNKEITINYSKDIPLSVKMGILPQDLIVPRGLILPTEMKVILGNLKIPLKQKQDKDDLVFFGKPAEKNEKKVSFTEKKEEPDETAVPIPELKSLKNKVLYASNFKENLINIIDSKTGRIDKELRLPSNPSNMVLTNDGRYLILTSLSSNKLFVIDTYNNTFVKDIEVGSFPSSILVSKYSDKAYVANKSSSKISVIDLNNMCWKKDIETSESPDNLVSYWKDDEIYYNDADTGNIYKLNISTNKSELITKAKNISKLALYKDFLYILSRTDSELIIFDLKENKEAAKIQVGSKPVDIKILKDRNEVYVLSAGSDELIIINPEKFEITQTIPLNSGGFPGKITLLENENRALITNQDAYQITLFDIKNREITGNMPISKNISFLQILK